MKASQPSIACCAEPDTRAAIASGLDQRPVGRLAGRLPFLEPVFRSAVASPGLPGDVVAEWSGENATITPGERTGASLAKDRGSVDAVDAPTRASGAALKATARPVRPGHIQEYPLDGEALLFDARTQTIYQLNETAYAVWRGCEGRTIRDLALDVAARFEVDPKTASEHILELVGLFLGGGLLTLEARDAVEV